MNDANKVARAVTVCGGVAKLYKSLGGEFHPIPVIPRTPGTLHTDKMRNYPRTLGK